RVLDHDGPRPRMGEQLLDPGRRAADVNAEGDGAGGHGAEVRGDPGLTVEGHDGDRLTRSDGEAEQTERELTHPLGVIAPGGGQPRAAVHRPECGAVPESGRLIVQRLKNRAGEV